MSRKFKLEVQQVPDRNKGQRLSVNLAHVFFPFPLGRGKRGRFERRQALSPSLSQREREISHLYISLWSYLKVALVS